MSKPEQRPYHHGNLREELLEAGMKMLETTGARDLSLRELSRELGVSHTAPRRHFPDKQALLDALALHGFALLGVAIAKALKDRSLDFKTRLVKLGRAYVGFAVKHPALLSMMFAAKHHDDAPAELLAAAERAFAPSSLAFEDGQAAGDVIPGDSKDLSLLAFTAMQGLVSLSHNGIFRGEKIDLLIGGILEHLILGLKPRKEPAR
ncbi:MAG: TetR family transcriptional regulator [Akkermansiaceae bacterium]|nr:TetR family transcriptional regulator [Akkermansiaceae bacterium]